MSGSLRRTGDSYKVVLLGEGRVGKTSLMLRYCEDKFNENHNSTLQASFLTKRLSNPPVSIAIWDTAGQERFHALGPLYYRDADGALLVYDITDADSFGRAKKWVNELHTVLGTDIILMLVGNKTDLAARRTVPLAEAQQFASSVGATHVEISVKLNQGVDELFQRIALAMIEARMRKSKSATSGPRVSTDQSFVTPTSSASARPRGGIQLAEESDGASPNANSKSCSC